MVSAINRKLIKKIIVCFVIALMPFNVIYGVNVTQLTQKKMNWIKAKGSVVWVGVRFERKKMIGCRTRDNHILVYKPWGLAKLYSLQEIVNCPDFFYQPSTKTSELTQ